MLTKIWTGTLLFFAWMLFCAWLVLVCREKNVHPLRDFARFFKKQTKAGRIIFGTFFIAMWIFASVKHTGLQPVHPLNGDTTLNIAGFAPITSTNTLRTIAADDFERGFVQTRIGTDEQFDFSPLANATIVSDWQAFGAATDWIYAAFTNWMFKGTTNDVSRLRIYSFGKIEALTREVNGAIAANNWFAPFSASLGIVPQANWSLLNESARPSLVWYAITPEGSLVITWQNALLDRDTDKPISFQIEFKPDGQFIYRYDLSRLNVDAVTNILAGASFDGNTWTTNSLPTNVTSMAFYPLSESDAYDQDPDNDGLLTIDELFFYDTNPHNADTDYDGLNDSEELLGYGSDPLDPNSISEAYCDGFAVKLGDLNPFSCPEGSTSTIYEHIFYTGTTNAPFAYPVDTNDTAVLTITVRGSGAGRIVIGDIVVTVMARPAPPPRRGSDGDTPDPTANSVRISLPRGVEFRIWGSIPKTLQVEIDAESYTIGRIPAWYTLERGWIAFPNTKAKEPCIHDLNAKKQLVYLDPGRDIRGLVCTWNATDRISVEAKSSLSAELTGNFPRSSTTPVTYTLTHPSHLYGPTQYTQTARFCPRLSEDNDDGLHGVGMPVDEEYGDEHGCSCSYGACCGNQWCDCGCACCESGGGETPANICAEHNCPYDQCEDLHRNAYTNAMAIASMADVLKLDRNPVYTKTIPIDVPDGWVKCCDCPDHWTNYVALAAKSYNLAVRTASGERFGRTVDDCSVYVHGLAPSRDFKDSDLSFCKTGVVYETHNYTVLGLDIGHPRCAVHEVAKWNSNFGFPVVATTNVNLGTEMYLRTDVDLPSGEINIKFDNPTVRFQLYLGGEHDDRKLLLDSAVHEDGRTLPLNVWKRLTEDFTSGRNTRITVVAFGGGTTTLRYSFAAIHDSRSVTDTRELRLSAILPTLVPDADGDGDFDDGDAMLCVSNRFYFWTNTDVWKNDDAFDLGFWDRIKGISHDDNGDDGNVNGRNDLVNLLPLAIRANDFLNAWHGRQVSIRIRSGSGGAVRRRYADIPWDDAKKSVCEDVETDDESRWWQFGDDLTLHAARLPLLDYSGDVLSTNVLSRCLASRGAVLVEADWECQNPLEFAVLVDGDEVFSCRPNIKFSNVDSMYRWRNIRSFADPGDWQDNLDGRPDSAESGTQVVFVHGYNVNVTEAREWGRALFKRLWWAGMKSDFTVVTWTGDQGQKYLVGEGLITPDYQGNVENAFKSASALASVITNLPGQRKYIIAHSLGNMLTSAAIQDVGFTYEKFFMLNAAVPIEAYDTNGCTAASIGHMTPADWRQYPVLWQAAHWHELFPANDSRRGLTWRGRFASVANTVNYYSDEEEVLANGNGDDVDVDRKFAWYYQEVHKGRKPYYPLYSTGRNEGGWAFNEFYAGHSPANAILPDQLKTMPFFKSFENQDVCNPTNGSAVVSVPDMRNQLLADAIPALSYAVGANPVELWRSATNGIVNVRNINMAQFKGPLTGDVFPYTQADEGLDFDNPQNWNHSFFIRVPYCIVFGLYEDIVTRINNSNKGN